jgi:hypothetical protein
MFKLEAVKHFVEEIRIESISGCQIEEVTGNCFPRERITTANGRLKIKKRRNIDGYVGI